MLSCLISGTKYTRRHLVGWFSRTCPLRRGSPSSRGARVILCEAGVPRERGDSTDPCHAGRKRPRFPGRHPLLTAIASYFSSVSGQLEDFAPCTARAWGRCALGRPGGASSGPTCSSPVLRDLPTVFPACVTPQIPDHQHGLSANRRFLFFISCSNLDVVRQCNAF